MDWLNNNAGVVVLVFGVAIIVLLAVSVWLLFYLKNRIAVQRLSFLGMYSRTLDSAKSYAEFTVGNKTLNTIGIAELGLRNGKVNYNLTEDYRRKLGLPADGKIVIEQRSSINFRLSTEELRKAVIVKDGKNKVYTLRAYAVDFTGTLYKGKVGNVRKLLKELLGEEKNGMGVRSAAVAEQPAYSETVYRPAEPVQRKPVENAVESAKTEDVVAAPPPPLPPQAATFSYDDFDEAEDVGKTNGEAEEEMNIPRN